MLVVFLWQWATVTANFGGNWSALFCTGSLRGVPPSLAGEHIYQFQGSEGFDGQMYHYIAHSPLMRSVELKGYVDAPRYRYRRILIPGMAWLLALGVSRGIDSAYIAVCLLWIGLGVFWSCRLSTNLGGLHAYGLTFLLLPAVLVSVDRLVTDGALAALAAAFVLYWERPSWRMVLILATATLVRDTGFLLLAGYCGRLLLERRWAMAVRYALCGVPALAWYLYLWAHTVPYAPILGVAWFPSALAAGFTNPLVYPPGTPFIPVLHAADLLVAAGLALGFCLTALLIFRGRLFPENLAGIFFVILGTLYFPQHVYDSGRVFTPMLLFLGIQALRGGSFLWLTPWLAVVPRVGMQMAPQILGVLRCAAPLK
jgi:hypothetical protein